MWAAGLSDSIFLTFLRTHGRLKPDGGLASDVKTSTEIDVGAEVSIRLIIAAFSSQLVGNACVLRASLPIPLLGDQHGLPPRGS